MLFAPLSHFSLAATTPSPQVLWHWEMVCTNPLNVSAYVDRQTCLSAWKRSIEYQPPSVSPSVAAFAVLSVYEPLSGLWTPPRSTTSWLLMKAQTSSSPVKPKTDGAALAATLA